MNRCIRSSYSHIFRSLTVTLLLILSFVLSVSCTISNATDTSTGIDGEIRVLQATQTIVDSIALSSDLILYVDPPNGHTSPTILGVFARASDVDALVYYEPSDESPTIDSPFITYNTPYIELGTLFKGSRNRTLTMVAVLTDELGTIRSEQITMDYFVEGASRPFSYGFMIPGVESGGYFLRFGMEVAAVARAQVAGGQEFADFFSELGKGTYIDQVDALNLLSLDPDLQGFEGGFPVNVSNNKFYGVLIPYHNGQEFFGKVVRVDLQAMDNVTECLERYRMESYDTSGNVIVTGTLDANGAVTSNSEACVAVLDLKTMHPNAKGFRKGFFGYPYGYLSPGEFDVLIRLDMEKFTLASTRKIDLSLIDRTYSGYSGGFIDGTWACYNPYKSYAGPVGGIRSTLRIDSNRLKPYFTSIMLCVNQTAWTASVDEISNSIRTLDFSIIEENLRGFSDAIRVGRFAYVSPLTPAQHVYSGQLIRISLGDVDIGTTIDDFTLSGGSIRNIVDILDLTKFDPVLKGFSGLFTMGRYLILVPFRNAFEPRNGQRGHGSLVRLNMNSFDLSGLEFIDLPTTTRTQVPSFADVDLRGFSYGFASGFYGVLVPFYNALFNGKVARFIMTEPSLSANVQQLDLAVDRKKPNTYIGFRGGFVSLWQGVEF